MIGFIQHQRSRFKTVCLALFVCVSLKAQTNELIEIKGIVIDESNTPMPGVNVIIKGKNKGTQTDFDGVFILKATTGDVVVFSYVGMETVEKIARTAEKWSIVLKEKNEALGEIVISTGYDKINKKTFTGAAKTIKAADFKIEGVVDVGRMLEGRVAGLNVQNVTGTFGAAPNITIRGNSSVLGNNTPLYVIDGVVQEDIVESNLNTLTSGNAETLISSSIAGVNANDIKKIDILKDASATAIYGARARNGVVVITTKSGRKNMPLKVKYTFEQTIRDIPKYSSYDILDSRENMSILQEMEAKGWLELPDVAQARYGGVYAIMAKRINTFDERTGKFLLENTQMAKNRFLQQYELANTDWFRALFQQSILKNHTLSINGGGAKNSYYTSIGFMSDPGWSIAENVRRITANIKNTTYFSENLSATIGANISIRKQRAPGTFSQSKSALRGEVSRNFDINPFSYAMNTSRMLRPRDNSGNLEYYRNNWADFNILNEVKNNYMALNQRDIRIQGDISWQINKHLSYNANTAIRYVNSVREHKITEGSNVVGAYNADETTVVRDANIFLYQDPDNPNAMKKAVLPKGGIYLKNDNFLTSYYLRNSLKYKNRFDNIWNLDVLVGQEIRYVDRDRTNFKGYGLQYENGYIPFTDPLILEAIINGGDNYFGINQTRERTVAFFGKANLSYKDRYILMFTGRFDGSNMQGKSTSSRWLPTGTISAKWNATQEDFLQDHPFINNLQMRTSYGLVATPGSATNAQAIFRSAITDRLLPDQRENSVIISELQNSQLTWEKQYEFNIGIDLGILKNRIRMTADVYHRNIFDNIDLVETSGIGGQSTKLGNNSTVSTKGIEFSIDTDNIKNDDFSWSTNFNIAYFKQEITKLMDKPRVFDLIGQAGGNLEGYPIGAIFSTRFKGLNNQGLPTFNVPSGKNEVTGINFQDRENLSDYLVYEGAAAPNITGGFSNKIRYKNWRLDILLTGAGGNKIRLRPVYSSSYSDLTVFTQDFKNRWILPGDEKKTTVPVIASRRMTENNSSLSAAYNAYNYSSERIADGTFIRLKNIGISYQIPKRITDKLGLSQLHFRAQATNVALLYSDDKLNGQDPEFFQSGGVAMPIRRQYTLSINVGF